MRTITITGLVAVAFLTFGTGCDSKVGECNALIKVINDAQAKIKFGGGADPAALDKAATDIDAAASAVGAAEVSLPELSKFRDDYKQLLTDTAKAMRDTATAAKSQDLAKLTSVTKDLSKAGANASKLTGEINTFCGGK